MPTLTASAGIENLIGLFSDVLDQTFEDSTVTSFTSTSVTLSVAAGTVFASGNSFAPDGSGGFTGNLESVTTNLNSGEVVVWSDIGLSITQIQSAYDLENDPPFDISAIENLLLPLDWDITTNDNVDVLTNKTTSSDGIKMHFIGDDYFDLKGGADTWFTSDGKDTVFAGSGGDTIDGGNDNDRLYGQAGNDVLIGSKGRDLLRGGKGEDSLDGGKGRDNLRGGTGDDELFGGRDDDKLRGEAGADLFIFDSQVSSSDYDTIIDYELGVDSVDIFANDGSTVTYANVTGGAELAYDGNTIFFVGLTATELSGDGNITIESLAVL